MVRLKKAGLAVVIAATIFVIISLLPSAQIHKVYSYQSQQDAPSLEQIIDAAGEDLRPQMIAGTIPQFSWFLAFDKLGMARYEKYIPSWLNLDLSFIYDIFLHHYAYAPTGGILLYKYNFTRLDDYDALYRYTQNLNRYSTAFTIKNTSLNKKFEIRIKPFIFSDCVPNNIPRHYCRVFSNDALKANYPATRDVNEAVHQYNIVTDAYKKINLTSPLGPNVDLSATAGWTAYQTETYAKEIASYMHAQGVAPTLKHFGYNAQKGDAHLEAYKDDRSLEELISNDFRPYYIVNSLSIPFFIMTTHFFINAIDKENVATRSQKVLDFIRHDFPNAIVMTDEVSMSGFSENDSYEQRIKEAKGDVILAHSGLGFDIWSRRSAIYRGVFERDQTETRISLLKILKMKQALGLIEIKSQKN